MLNTLELFGGCGGLGYGFHKKGFNIVCCNELEDSIAQSYKCNFPETNLVVGDITNENIKKKIYKIFESTKCNVILGGPPCVAYSMSGLRNSRDPRGQLFKDYVEIVNKLKPEVFVMENVKGILTMKHDKDKLTKEEKKIADKYYKLEEEKLNLEKLRKNMSIEKRKNKEGKENKYSEETEKEIEKEFILYKKKIKSMDNEINTIRIHVYQKIINTFNEIGYKVEHKLHNSANFGVPQRRERVIFIGVRDNSIPIYFPETTHSKNIDEGKIKWISVKEAIDDLKNNDEDKETSHIYTKHKPEFIEKIEKTECGKSVNKKYTEAFFRCKPDEPSGTVKENHGGVFIHYEKNRVMTPRELARLQSFPDSFKFMGSKSSILKQLGNAVPCKLAEAIAGSVLKMLSS